jgi:hypothetical protein
MTVRVDKVAWDVNVWYHMKLRVENRTDGTTGAGQGLEARRSEPAAWTIQKVDRIPSQRIARHLRRRDLGRDVRQFEGVRINEHLELKGLKNDLPIFKRSLRQEQE